MRTAGIATAQMDLDLSSPEQKNHPQNCYDLLTEGGFSSLGSMQHL